MSDFFDDDDEEEYNDNIYNLNTNRYIINSSNNNQYNNCYKSNQFYHNFDNNFYYFDNSSPNIKEQRKREQEEQRRRRQQQQQQQQQEQLSQIPVPSIISVSPAVPQLPESKKIRIRIISWNMGSNQKTEDEWHDDIKKYWDIIQFVHQYDVLVVNVQENHEENSKFGKFGDAIAKILHDTHLYQKKYQNPLISKLGNFTVSMYIFIPIALKPKTKKSDTICLSTPHCTKSSVFVEVTIAQIPFIFIGSHLPVSGKNKLDYGLDKRNEARQKVINKIKQFPDHNKSVIIWAGDMNYRHIGGKDQLTTVLSKQNPKTDPVKFNEEEIKFDYTCKLKRCQSSETSCTLKRTPHNTRSDDAFESNRDHSHCDRIIYYKPNGVNTVVKTYTNWTNNSSVMNSDHDVVYMDIEVSK